MKIIFFGTSQFAIPIVEALIKNNLPPRLVVTSPDKPRGRGQSLQSPPVGIWAKAHNLPVIQPEQLSADEQALTAKDADIFIVASYGKIIPKAWLGIPKYGSLNVHPSLLPKYRGSSPIQAAILNGDNRTGVTIMLMDEELDHGPILAMSNFRFPVSKLYYPELEKKLAELGAELLIETIPKWVAGKINPLEQDHSGATYTKKILKKDGHINWREPAEIIERKIRAYSPSPGAYFFWSRLGKKIRIQITEAGTATPNTELAPGTTFKIMNELAVAADNSAILIKRLKMESKNPMPSPDLLNGYPDIIGAILV